ncbi:aspartate/glutamate racemase family protein [Tumebacillus sp. DT12]|uniref:Aspartate/glutamate racemase family protein n=1 Tax=Tumebacillus lacus TaxID=2995335 RepID=A0ABT3WYT4_9BACL|nr:aspartate/glutamate racemase family protein [Tumebacillus lacus]MCX7569829.1 aspartate/glutamate racemase family protein [Tumebacillus lacus]
MKTIGLLGGMSWESTALYYQLINQLVREKLGGLHSAKVVMHSFNFEEIVACQKAGEWQKAADMLLDAARKLEASGADMLLICTNTMHTLAPQIQAGLNIQLLHIADVTAEALREKGVRQAALLGTLYTMEQNFYRERLKAHGVDMIVPGAAERQDVHDIIFDELCQGVIKESSRTRYREIMTQLAEEQGAEGIILGCTEIPLLVREEDARVPLFDTTYLHARKAVEMALN